MDQEEISQIVDDIRDGMLCAWDTYGWIQGAEGDNEQGYCLVGAWNRATGRDWGLYNLFEKCAQNVIADLFPGRPLSIISFNDFEHASEEDVRLLVKHSFEKMKDVLPELINSEPTVTAAAMDAPE